MEQLIINALKSVCGNRNIKFQVIIKDNLLHIYANHRQDYHPQYVTLEENVCAAIASLGLEAIDSVWLYGRPLGQTEPNWQVFVELPTQVTNKREEDTKGGDIEDIDPLDNLPDLESLTDAKEGSEFKPNIQDSREDTEALSEVWHQEDTESISEALRAEFDVTEFIDFSDATSNSIGDTGLLQNTGFVHGSPLKEAEINTLSPNFSFDRVAENATPEVDSQAQYCFITNRKLLTEQTCDPTRDTMRMVKFFHHLSEADRQQLLPILDSYFRESITPGLETTIPAIQNWVEKIKDLGEEDRHLLAVWLSRYCFNPEVTLEEFEQISAANAAESNSKNSKKASTTEYSFVSLARDSFSDSAIDDLELDKPKFQLPPIVKKLLLPGVWILTTVILIILSIFNHNSSTIATSARIPALCRNTIGSPEYCRLAVNLAGEKAIAQAPTSLFPLTEVTESVATYGCGRYANLKAGIEISKIPPATTPVISTYGEKVFPHIYVTQVEQKHAQKSGNIKVGCVYTTGKGQRSPKKLAADIIPLQLAHRTLSTNGTRK